MLIRLHKLSIVKDLGLLEVGLTKILQICDAHFVKGLFSLRSSLCSEDTETIHEEWLVIRGEQKSATLKHL